MKNTTAQKRVFKRINKEYPLLRNGLKAYFVEVILLTYQGFNLDEGYDDMTFTEKLNYSYEINTCDEYHNIINDYNNNISNKSYYETLYKEMRGL